MTDNTTMLERAARALYPKLAAWADFNDEGFDDFDTAKADGSAIVEDAYEAARAALQAIREPNPNVWRDGGDIYDSWPAMVDAILSEGQTNG